MLIGGAVFDGRDLDGAERLVDGWQEAFERRAAQARELAAKMTVLTASASSADDLIEVTVGQSGELTDLRLDEDIRQRPAAQTARDILATVAAARAVFARRVTEAVAETVGAESETGRAVLAGYPQADR